MYKMQSGNNHIPTENFRILQIIGTNCSSLLIIFFKTPPIKNLLSIDNSLRNPRCHSS